MDNSSIKENTERSDPEYSTGFNSGFLIGAYNSELSDKMLISLNNMNIEEKGVYYKGLRYGMLEGDLQKSKNVGKEINNQKDQNKEKDNDMEIER